MVPLQKPEIPQQAVPPVCWRIGETTVRIRYSDAGESLGDKLQRYFISLKSRCISHRQAVCPSCGGQDKEVF